MAHHEVNMHLLLCYFRILVPYIFESIHASCAFLFNFVNFFAILLYSKKNPPVIYFARAGNETYNLISYRHSFKLTAAIKAEKTSAFQRALSIRLTN